MTAQSCKLLALYRQHIMKPSVFEDKVAKTPVHALWANSLWVWQALASVSATMRWKNAQINNPLHFEWSIRVSCGCKNLEDANLIGFDIFESASCLTLPSHFMDWYAVSNYAVRFRGLPGQGYSPTCVDRNSSGYAQFPRIGDSFFFNPFNRTLDTWEPTMYGHLVVNM